MAGINFVPVTSDVAAELDNHISDFGGGGLPDGAVFHVNGHDWRQQQKNGVNTDIISPVFTTDEGVDLFVNAMRRKVVNADGEILKPSGTASLALIAVINANDSKKARAETLEAAVKELKKYPIKVTVIDIVRKDTEGRIYPSTYRRYDFVTNASASTEAPAEAPANNKKTKK